MSDEGSRVTCATCGYLALRRNDSRELVEYEYGMRGADGIPFNRTNDFDAQRKAYEISPICAVQAFSLAKEMRDGGGGQNEEKRWNVIQALRLCEKHTNWLQGLSPKEHIEMDLLQKQREWQAQREDAQIAYQRDRDASLERQAKEQREFQEREAALTREHNDRSIAVAKQQAKDARSYSTKSLVAAIGGSVISAGVAAYGILNAPKAVPVTVTVAQQPFPAIPTPPPATINVVYPEQNPEPVLPKLVDELKGLFPAP